MKISGIYRITNIITGDFYIGSSKDLKNRWANHKCKSKWNEQPNSLLYLDMKRYGTDKFAFEILEEAEPGQLKEVEQQFIEKLQPTYNQMNAKGLNIERYKEYQKEYQKSERARESQKKSRNKYNNQLCCYNGETLTLHALVIRFSRAGIDHPTAEAKKYLLH